MKILVVDNGTNLLKDLETLTHTQALVAYSNVTKEITEGVDVVVLSGSTGTFPIMGNEDRLLREMELIRESTIPIIGICYGAQLIAHTFGSVLETMDEKHTGDVVVRPLIDDPIFAGRKEFHAYENHGWRIVSLPHDFETLAVSDHAIEVFRHKERPLWGIQFHPEHQTAIKEGDEIFRNIIQQITRT